MAETMVDLPPRGGFNFDLCRRNAMLEKTGIALPRFRKTGTTIVGIVFKDGVILGADTRATEGETVCDKNCEKIHYIAPNIYCCGAGTAADTENVTGFQLVGFVNSTAANTICYEELALKGLLYRDMVRSQLELHRYATGRDSRVVTSLTMLKTHLFGYRGQVSAALVLGGVDITGPHLHTVYPHGSTDTLPFATMGSGSLAAMSVFESGYKEDMTKEEGMILVSAAICAGIFNDLGSGSNVDLCILTKGQKEAEYLRNYQKPNPRSYVHSKGYTFAKGYTAVLSTKIVPFRDNVTVLEGDAMEE